MATTKARTSLWATNTLTASAGDETSSVIDLSDGYGAQVSVVITNGATGPSVAAQCQVWVANDYNAGSPTLFTHFGGPLIAGTTNSGVYRWSVNLPIEVAAMKLTAGSNVTQDVTIDADISEVTAV